MMYTNFPQQMSLWEAPHVRTSPLPEVEKDSAGRDTFGRRCDALFSHLGRDASFLRMLKAEFQQGFSMSFAVTWNLTATQRGRWYIQLAYSVRPMNDTECLSLVLWPTPTASDNRDRKPGNRQVVTRNGTVRPINSKGTQSIMRTSQAVQFWATPTAQDHKNYTLPPSVLGWDSVPGNLLGLKYAEYYNPAWLEQLMGLPPGWTSPDGRRGKAHSSILMSRREQLKRRRRITENESPL